MSRYVTIPTDIKLIDPVTDKPTDQSASFADVVRGLFQDGRFHQALGVGGRKFLRKSLLTAKPGEVVEVKDEHWDKAMPLFREAANLTATFLDSGGDEMLCAFTDAPTKDPRKAKTAK